MTDDDNSDRRQTIFDADRAAQPLNQNVDLPSTVEEEAKQYNKENFAPAIANDKRTDSARSAANRFQPLPGYRASLTSSVMHKLATSTFEFLDRNDLFADLLIQ